MREPSHLLDDTGFRGEGSEYVALEDLLLDHGVDLAINSSLYELDGLIVLNGNF
jgi:hypothetical protein